MEVETAIKVVTWYEALFNFALMAIMLFILYHVVLKLIEWARGDKVNFLKDAQLKLIDEAIINCPTGLGYLRIRNLEKTMGKIVGWTPDGIEIFADQDKAEAKKIYKHMEMFIVATNWAESFPLRLLNFRANKLLILIPTELRSRPLRGTVEVDTWGFKNVLDFLVPYDSKINETCILNWMGGKTKNEYIQELEERFGASVEGALDMNPKSDTFKNPVADIISSEKK